MLSRSDWDKVSQSSYLAEILSMEGGFWLNKPKDILIKLTKSYAFLMQTYRIYTNPIRHRSILLTHPAQKGRATIFPITLQRASTDLEIAHRHTQLSHTELGASQLHFRATALALDFEYE